MTANPTEAVVTGVGALTPVGGDVTSSWKALLAGRSGVARIERHGFDELPARIAARSAADPAERLSRVEARRLDRCGQFALVAARAAWSDAGRPEVDSERLGVVVGTGIGGLLTTMESYERYQQRGWHGLSPYTVTMLTPDAPATTLSLELGAAGTLESLATILALCDHTAPPTVNLETVDPEVELDVVGGETRTLPSAGQHALCNSFGFGGHNVSLVFRPPSSVPG